MIPKLFDYFDAIDSTKGRKAKISIIEELLADESLKELTRKILTWAYDPLLTFGVVVVEKSLPPANHESLSDIDLLDHWQTTEILLQNLATRRLTGHAAKDAVTNCFYPLNKQQQRWYMGIFNRNLRISGVSVDTWSTWFPELKSPIAPQLCEPYDNREFNGEWCAEAKLDGVRCILVWDAAERTVEIFSREGKPLYNHDHIDRAFLSTWGIDSRVLDGELMASTFAETMKIVSKQTPHPNAAALQFHVFDEIPFQEWNEKRAVTPLSIRQTNLSQTLAQINSPFIHRVQGEIIHSKEDAEAVMSKMVDVGYEGCIVKNLAAPYEFGRSKTWMKLKPNADADLLIESAVEGNHRLVGTLGTFVVSGTVFFKGKEYHVRSEVGSGFSDVQRNEFWQQFQAGTLKGKIAEVRFQEVSQDVKTGEYSLRFPRFIRMREDRIRA